MVKEKLLVKEKLTSRKRQAIETKRKIHEVALNLITSFGFENISIRDICAAANVSTGTFYHHFTSKDEVFTLSSTRLDENTYSTFSQLDRSAPFTEQIVQLFIGQARHITLRGPDITAYTMSIHLKKPELNIFSRNRPFYHLACQLTREGQTAGEITKELTAEEICDIAQATFRGLWIDWCTSENRSDLMQKTRFYLETLLRSVTLSIPQKK